MKIQKLIIGIVALVAIVALGELVMADSPVDGRPGHVEVRFLEGYAEAEN